MVVVEKRELYDIRDKTKCASIDKTGNNKSEPGGGGDNKAVERPDARQ